MPALAYSEVAPNGNGTSRHFVVISQCNGLNVRKVGGIVDDQLIRRGNQYPWSAARDHDTI